jgi:hypothetical protein
LSRSVEMGLPLDADPMYIAAEAWNNANHLNTLPSPYNWTFLACTYEKAWYLTNDTVSC